ncbi:TPA: hypothetical protein ACRMM3_006755, partial [Pseudomonas aeruginosa]
KNSAKYMTDREKAGQPPRFSWGGALCRRMFAVRFQAVTVTLSSVLAALTVSATLVLSKAFCLSEAATIAPCEVWVGLALLAAMVLPLKT